MRFDETALQSHFGHTSRSSSEFYPIRTGSGLGSLPMVERSASHKSDGRQSSTGHSTHSTRLNSLAFDSRSPALESQVNIGPPPGLLLLGPLPCIMRCWLDDTFSNEALLYAAICTGSYTSTISSRLASKYGIIKQASMRGPNKVTLNVFLPEATIQQASSRPLNLIPQVPSISIDFEVFDLAGNDDSLQVIIGSDVLRSKSAELSFSQDRMTIFDDERNRLVVPLVRPENSSMFQKLRTTPVAMTVTSSRPQNRNSEGNTVDTQALDRENDIQMQRTSQASSGAVGERKPAEPTANSLLPSNAAPQPVKGSTEPRESGAYEISNMGDVVTKVGGDSQVREVSNGTDSSTPTKETQGGMWGSWRRDSNQVPPADSTFSNIASTSNYQRPGRGKGMKVLKPARSGTSRSASSVQNPSNLEQTPSRWPEPPPRLSGVNAIESPESKTPDSPRRSFSSEARASFSSTTGKSRNTNPVGGASAFGWLNSAQK